MRNHTMVVHAARLRARFLAAMGLPAAAGVGLSCSPPRLPEDPTQVEVLDAKDLSRSDLPQGAWAVDYANRPTPSHPTCPNGNFCVVGARDGARGNAPAPFASCAMAVPFPHEPRPANQTPGGPAWVGGPDVNEMDRYYDVRFVANWTAHERKAKNADACCYAWVRPCPGGRPLRDATGAAVTAPIAKDPGGWTRGKEPNARDLARAQRWARAAQFEHASVASFAQFSLQLMALGAPADLIVRAHRAALDEIQHAKLAFTLAAALGLEEIGPGPLPTAAATLEVTPEAVLLSTLRDGCVAETLAALEARRDLADARSAVEREALERIAEDEERHAELAFATIAWLIATFGAPVRDALTRELDRIATGSERGSTLGVVERTIVLPCIRCLLVPPAHGGDPGMPFPNKSRLYAKV